MKKITISLVFILISTLIFWNLKNRKIITEDHVDSVGAVETGLVNTNSDVTQQDSRESDDNHFEGHLKSLPTIDDLKNLTEEEVHHTPEIIKDGGELVGVIYDEAQKDPTKRVDAMNFFRKCAEDEKVAVPIRAVCLNRVYKLIPEWEAPVPLIDSKISDEVLDLSMKLP
ncbi:MAG TPA: hypothetical protein VKZ84_00530 [Bacteriovoracaceae bacterium]|nr:hypothetical protein [Bacteriovoracaceae bacterium]